jgi:ribosomal protein L7/L12
MTAEVIVTENQLPAEVIRAIEQGRKIEAIKILREKTGLGLANAKVLVDRAYRTHGPQKQAPGAISNESGVAKLAKSGFLVIILLGIYYFYFNA